MELISRPQLKNHIKKQLRTIQKADDSALYPNQKRASDKIVCVVCGGCYTRQQRSTHLTRKKHIKALDKIYENYNIK